MIEERKQDIFDNTEDYHYAHCISSDYALGAGIAVNFQKKFYLKENLYKTGKGIYPDCIKIGRVFNLVTKKNYWNKPTNETLTSALVMMKEQAVEQGITKIAMPRIGCGLDRLKWHEVKQIIENTFKDTDIDILVCYL
jgi:predicted nucleotide-binding protein (sugar kinase/HSP70/actin superfamily)